MRLRILRRPEQDLRRRLWARKRTNAYSPESKIMFSILSMCVSLFLRRMALVSLGATYPWSLHMQRAIPLWSLNLIMHTRWSTGAPYHCCRWKGAQQDALFCSVIEHTLWGFPVLSEDGANPSSMKCRSGVDERSRIRTCKLGRWTGQLTYATLSLTCYSSPSASRARRR
jgi:hypothetical protein